MPGRCVAGAKGFTFQGREPHPHGRVLCYFKRSSLSRAHALSLSPIPSHACVHTHTHTLSHTLYVCSSEAGNADPNWQTYTPHMTHKVGALGGGNDVESGQYTLEEASLRCLSLPQAVGFTFQGSPNQPGKLMCYFKSVAAGNADPNWQTYVKSPGAPVLGQGRGGHHRHPGAHPGHPRGHPGHHGGHHGGPQRGGVGRPPATATPQMPLGVQLLSKNHPTECTDCAGAPPRNGLTLEQVGDKDFFPPSPIQFIVHV